MAPDEKAAVGLEEKRIKADRLMDLLMKDEKVKRLLFQKLQDLNKSSKPHHSKQATSYPKTVEDHGTFSCWLNVVFQPILSLIENVEKSLDSRRAHTATTIGLVDFGSCLAFH